MNWIKLEEMFPNVCKEIRELEKEGLHYDSKNLIEIYHKNKGVFMKFPFTESLKTIEQSIS